MIEIYEWYVKSVVAINSPPYFELTPSKNCMYINIVLSVSFSNQVLIFFLFASDLFCFWDFILKSDPVILLEPEIPQKVYEYKSRTIIFFSYRTLSVVSINTKPILIYMYKTTIINNKMP